MLIEWQRDDSRSKKRPKIPAKRNLLQIGAWASGCDPVSGSGPVSSARRLADLEHLGRLPGDDLLEPRSPARECALHLGKFLETVVDGGDILIDPAMIQDARDDRVVKSQLAQISRAGPAQIVGVKWKSTTS